MQDVIASGTLFVPTKQSALVLVIASDMLFMPTKQSLRVEYKQCVVLPIRAEIASSPSALLAMTFFAMTSIGLLPVIASGTLFVPAKQSALVLVIASGTLFVPTKQSLRVEYKQRVVLPIRAEIASLRSQ